MTVNEITNELAIITGVPGWLGTTLLETLILGNGGSKDRSKSGALRAVRAFGFKNQDISALAHLNQQFQYVPGDLTTGDGLAELMENAAGATVFHLAGVIHPQSRKEFYQVNLEGTRLMLAAAVNAGVRRFIYVSSNSPLGCNTSSNAADLFDEKTPYNPYMHYGRSKKMAEDLVNLTGRNSSMETVIIRPPWFYGPNQPARQTLFFSMIKNGKMPIVGNGENLRSMAYVDNICQGLLLAESVEQARGKTYWIADSQPYTMNQIVDTVEAVLERDFQIVCAHKRMHLPDLASDVAYIVDSTLQGFGLYQQKVHVLSEMNKNIACKIELARAELGYNPQIALEEGMRRSIKWILDRGQTI